MVRLVQLVLRYVGAANDTVVITKEVALFSDGDSRDVFFWFSSRVAMNFIR